MIIRAECIGVGCSSGQRQSGGGSGGGGVHHRSTAGDVKKQSSCKFDSTGMFHWCPSQSMSACVVVSQFKSPSIDGRGLFNSYHEKGEFLWEICVVPL